MGLQKSNHTIPTLKLNHKFAEKDIDKANMLNDYFCSQAVVNDSNKPLPQHTFTCNSRLKSITISQQYVRDVLNNLNVTKASGPDLISPRLLKECATILSKPLSIIFNRSLLQGYFPSNWKDANVTAIYKKADKSMPSNYRPISLLSQIGKAMERYIHKHLYNYISENNLLTPFQSGFIQGDSTTFHLLHTYHSFLEAVDSGKEVRVVFCDISKAFDRVWHRGLLHKLAGMGLSEGLLRWFKSYLSHQRQRVVLNGVESNWADVLAGVPQGSILGPLLFLIYINDIVNNIRSSIRLFADDTTIYIIIDNPQTAAFILNTDLLFCQPRVEVTSCFVYKVMGLTFHDRINIHLIYRFELAQVVARRITKPQRKFFRFEPHWLLFFFYSVLFYFSFCWWVDGGPILCAGWE